MANIQLEERTREIRNGGESVVDLLVDLDILCQKLENLGEETLIFCSGSDIVITSSVAATFFKEVDTVFSKFKDFCSTHQPAIGQKQPFVPEKSTLENIIPSESMLTAVPIDKSFQDSSFHETASLVSVEDKLVIDCYNEDTDDGIEENNKTEPPADEIKDTPNTRSRTMENESTNIQLQSNQRAEGFPSNTGYLDGGKASDGMKKTKLDGTDYFWNKINLNPSVSLKRIDDNKNRENSSLKGNKYVVANNEKLLLITPEESGVDFTKDENSSFNCFMCDKVSSSLSRLREHLTKFHKVKIGHQCVCGRFFQETELYKKHIDHRMYNMYHHECEHCNGIYPSISALKSHIVREHDNNAEDIIVSQTEKLGDYPCLKCETMFHHEQHLIDHNDNLPDCDVAVKDDKTIEKDLADSEIMYKTEDGNEVKTTYGEILATRNEQPFACPCCGDSFNRRSNFQRHVLRHVSQGTHLCLICGNKLKGKDGLQRHLNQHMVRPYNCSKCRSKFTSQAELTDHMNSRCKEGQREDFKCDLCDHISSNMSSLKVHKNMHAGLKPFKCGKCDKSFATKSSLYRHDAVRHQDATPFHCNHCHKAFKTKDNLKKHSKVHQEPKYSCEICGKACIEKGNLKKHMRTHTQEKPFVCELCGKAYGRKSLLDNHRRLHTGEKPYKCTKEGCIKAFRSYSNLKQHIRNHSTTHPYVCDVCGKMFKQPGRLNHHRKDHTIDYRWPCAYCEEKFRSIFMYKGHLAKFHPEMKTEIEEKTNIRLYECDMCHKMYGDKDDLTRHIYIHQNIKPFSCQYCSKSFNDKSNMRQHEKIHTGVKHHWCDVCKKGFIHKRDLRNHMQTNHVKDESDVKPVREKKPRRKPLLNINSSESQGSYLEFTPVSTVDVNALMPSDSQDDKKRVQTVIEEQPRDLTTQPSITYLTSDASMPISNFPVAAVNAATGQIEPLMLMNNYQ